MRGRSVLGLVALLVLALGLWGCGSSGGSQPAAAKPVVIKLVSAWPEGDLDNVGLLILDKKVKELGKGKVELQLAGGPEAVPPMELGEAVRSGAVDMAWLHPAYYTASFPLGTVLDYSDHRWSELLTNGGFQYLNEQHNKQMNMQVIGAADNGTGYSLYFNKPVKTLNDIKGKRVRVSGTYLPFLKAMGAETVIMPTGEIYGALERGVIDGFASPSYGIQARKLDEIVKYKIQPYYWQVLSLSVMNLAKWNSLSKEVQDILSQASRATEKELPGEMTKLLEKENQALKAKGIAIVDIDQPDRYLALAKEAAISKVREVLKDGTADEVVKRFFK